MTVAMMVEKTATISVLMTARRIASLASILPYHSTEKPVQAVGRPLSLKDSAISTTIGP